jgi:hypothetical protein
MKLIFYLCHGGMKISLTLLVFSRNFQRSRGNERLKSNYIPKHKEFSATVGVQNSIQLDSKEGKK